MVQAIRTEVHFAGPLPPANELARYDAVLPGLADRIVKMAEANATHRQALERSVVEGNVVAQLRGQILAFTLALVVAGIGGFLVFSDKATLGLWLILGDLLSLAAVFVTGKVLQWREREARRREIAGPAAGQD